MINVYSAVEVALHNKEDDLWVIYDGEVYDVTYFVQDHPGGKELIIHYAGSDITEAFATDHLHSDYAIALLKDYHVGMLEEAHDYRGDRLRVSVTGEAAQNRVKGTKGHSSRSGTVDLQAKDDAFLDLKRPIMPQVWRNSWSKNYYLEQVHIPRHTTQGPRFFASNFLESFTKNTWQGVLVVWIPVICACLWYTSREHTGSQVIQLFANGLVLWTIYEYLFHRFAFHMERALPDHPVAFTLHFLMHGVHHFLPMDRYRLVMPPLLLASLSVPVVTFLVWLLDWSVTCGLLAGTYTGYIIYDMMHYYFHHGPSIAGYLARMKRYHMDHHYVDPNLGFGVSNMTWDAFFDTLLPYKTSLDRSSHLE